MNNISFWIFCLSYLFAIEELLCESNLIDIEFRLFPFGSSCEWKFLFLMSIYLNFSSLLLQCINIIYTIITVTINKNKKIIELPIFPFVVLTSSIFLIFYLPNLILAIKLILYGYSDISFYNFVFRHSIK
jgi:heme/copper-type cytochrome/quinol oxidase subunit 1